MVSCFVQDHANLDTLLYLLYCQSIFVVLYYRVGLARRKGGGGSLFFSVYYNAFAFSL